MLFKSDRCLKRASELLIMTDISDPGLSFFVFIFQDNHCYEFLNILSEVFYLYISIIYIYHCRFFVIKDTKLYKITSMMQYNIVDFTMQILVSFHFLSGRDGLLSVHAVRKLF